MTYQEQQEFSVLQAKDYANALSEIDDKQAALLLSTQGVTTAQIQQTLAAKGLTTEEQYQAMAEAGLLARKQQLRNVDLQSILTSQLGSEAKAKETIASLGLTAAIEGEEAQTVQLTAKKLKQAVTDGILTKEEAELLGMTLGVSVAQKSQISTVMPKWIANMKAMTLATWEQVKATAAWLITNPAGWATLAVGAIATVITFVISYNKKLEETKEKIKEAAEEAKAAIDDIKSEFDTLSSTTDNIKERFAKLAQGVKNLGSANQSRGTLSTDDYNEFLDLSNQLAELFPQLTKGYDDNGNAILGLSGNVDTIVGSLDNLVSVQQKLANQEILEKMASVWTGYTVDLKEYKETLTDSQKMANGALDAISEIELNGNVFTVKASKYDNNSDPDTAIQKALEKMGFGNINNAWGGLYDVNAKLTGETHWDFSSFSDSQIEALKETLGIIGAEYEKNVQLTKNKIKSANSEMSGYINTWLTSGSGEWSFAQMDSDMQNLVKDVLINSDWISQLPNDVDTSKWSEVSNWLEQEFLFAVNQIDDKKIQTALTDAFNGEFTIESLQEAVSQLINTEGFDINNPLIIYLQAKLDDADTLAKSYEEAKIKAARKFNSGSAVYDYSEYDKFMKKNSIDTQEEIAFWEQCIEESKTKEEAMERYLNSDDSSYTPASFTDIFSLEDAENELTALGKISESIDTIQNAYKTLNDAIDEYNENGAFSIDTLQSVISLGDNWLDYLVDEEGNLTLNKESLRQLTLSRLEDMRVQTVNSLIDNVSKIKTDADANKYLASTNYALAESYDEVGQKALASARAQMQAAVNAGTLSQSNMDAAMSKATADVDKIYKLFSSTDVSDFSLSGSSSPSASSSSSTSSKDYDWIETRLNRLQTLIDQCTKSVEQFSDADMKNTGIDVLIAGTEKLQSNTQSAYDKYMQLADSVNLSDDLKSLVRDGAIDISSISNDEISDAIDEYKKYFDAAEDLKSELQEINTELGELHIQKLDNVISDICDGLDYANEKMDNLLDLMSNAADYDGTELTGAGLSKAHLYNLQLQNATKNAEKYNELIEELNSLYKTGKITQAQYTEKFKEYQTAQNKAAASAKEYENAIVDLIKNGIQAQIDAMDELTQKKLDALKADKEQNEYADTIAEKQRYIANLEKQIAQLALSDDRSDTAARLQLQEELAEAKKDLTDEQAEHSYNTLVDSLEAENTAYTEAKEAEQELLDNDLEYRSQAISDFLMNVDSQYGSVYATLDEYAAAYNLNLTEQLTTPWQYGISSVESYANAINALNNISVPDFNSMFGSGGDGISAKTSNTSLTAAGWEIVDQSGKSLYQFKDKDTAKEYLKRYITPHYSWEKYKVQAYYAKGTSNAKKGLALTQENGLEAIMTDKGLLTPLKGGEAVFSNEATQRLYEFSQNPEKYINSFNIPVSSFSVPVPEIDKRPEMVINNSSNNNFVINGHLNDTEKKELTNLIDGQIDKTFRKIRSRVYK